MKIFQILVLIFGLTVFINAQKENLSGKVYDQAGAIISETRISLTNKEGKKFVTYTNDDGAYQVSIPSGIYLFEAEYPKHQGWKKFIIEKYEIASVVKMTLDIILPVNEEWTEKFGNKVVGKPIKDTKSKRKNNKNK